MNTLFTYICGHVIYMIFDDRFKNVNISNMSSLIIHQLTDSLNWYIYIYAYYNI